MTPAEFMSRLRFYAEKVDHEGAMAFARQHYADVRHSLSEEDDATVEGICEGASMSLAGKREAEERAKAVSQR